MGDGPYLHPHRRQTRARIGSLLLTILVEANAWFEVIVERQGPRQTRILKMTEAGQAFVADRHAQNELMRPYLLPMICEPQDYVYQDDARLEVA